MNVIVNGYEIIMIKTLINNIILKVSAESNIDKNLLNDFIQSEVLPAFDGKLDA